MPRLLLLGLALLLAACAHHPAPRINETTTQVVLSIDALDTLRADTIAAFRASDFATLERLAAELRATLPRTPDGGHALAWFYDSFAPAHHDIPRDDALAILTAWQAASDGRLSPTRAAATALYWRKQDTTGVPTETRATWSRARSAAIRNEIPNSACPHLAIERHLRLTSRDADRPLAAAIHSEAIAAFPGYTPLIESHAGWLSGFAAPEVGPWLAAAADQVPAPESDEVYAVVAISRPRSTFDWIEARNLDLARIARGLHSFQNRWPAASGTLDRLAQAAETHRDIPLLRATLRRIESAPHQPTWSDNLGSYLRARRLAGLEKPANLRPALALKLDRLGHRVAFSPDGQTIVVGCARGEILAFSTRDLTPLWDLKVPRWVSDLAFSPDGNLLVATGGHHHGVSGGGVWIWNAHTREEIASDNTLPLPLYASSFSPDSRTLWLGGGAGSSEQLLRWSAAHPGFTRLSAPQIPASIIQSLDASNDAVFFPARHKLWRLDATAPDARPLALAEGAPYSAVALHPGEARIALGEWGKREDWLTPGRFHLLPTPPREAPLRTEPNSTQTLRGSKIERLAWSPDGRLLGVLSSTAEFKIWRAASDRPWLHAYVSDAWGISDLTFSPDSKLVATVDNGSHLRLWPLSAIPSPTPPRWPVK
jgi:WD40 repeat protein